MCKISLLTLMICVLSYITSGDNINHYAFNNIKTIQIGKEEGKIGFVKKTFGGMPHGPMTFHISSKNEIYVPDFANGRINVYDLILNFITTITEKENKLMHNAGSGGLTTDNEGNIIVFSDYIKKINPAGETIFYIDSDTKPKALFAHVGFVIDHDIFFPEENGQVYSISSAGKIRESNDTKLLLKQLNGQSDLQQSNLKITSQGFLDGKKYIEDLRKDGKHLIIGDRIYSMDFSSIEQFYKKTKPYFNSLKSLNNIRTDGNQKSILQLNESSLRESQLIGYDADHNSYWLSLLGPSFIFIYSNIGDVIDAFYFDELKNKNVLNGTLIHIAVALNGDVYFMRNDETGSYFYKITRRW